MHGARRARSGCRSAHPVGSTRRRDPFWTRFRRRAGMSSSRAWPPAGMGAYRAAVRSPKLRSARPAVRHASAIAFLAGVTLLFFSGLVIGRTYSEVARYERTVFPWGNPAALATSPRIIHYDQAKSYYPWQVFINNSLRDGVVPLWNPYSFGGTPFLAA